MASTECPSVDSDLHQPAMTVSVIAKLRVMGSRSQPLSWRVFRPCRGVGKPTTNGSIPGRLRRYRPEPGGTGNSLTSKSESTVGQRVLSVSEQDSAAMFTLDPSVTAGMA